MIFGLHHCLMDEKGRVAFPAGLRPALGPGGADHGTGADGAVSGDGENNNRFILTQSLYEPCLVGMTEAAFTEQAKKVAALPPSHPAVSLYKRFVIAPATVAVIDKAGRVNVPKEQREYAGLERDCVWLGVLDRIELWSRTRYDELRRRHAEEDLASTRAYLAEHGL
jgi:MraZ protein